MYVNPTLPIHPIPSMKKKTYMRMPPTGYTAVNRIRPRNQMVMSYTDSSEIESTQISIRYWCLFFKGRLFNLLCYFGCRWSKIGERSMNCSRKKTINTAQSFSINKKAMLWNLKTKLLSDRGSELVFMITTKYDFSWMKCDRKKKKKQPCVIMA